VMSSPSLTELAHDFVRWRVFLFYDFRRARSD
jgi:hypothetical protein